MRRKRFVKKTIPSEFELMDEFLSENKLECTEHVISSIEYAVKHNLPNIEVFNFEDTDYMIIISSDSFKENLENIYNYYIESEQYEFCNRVIELKKLIQRDNNNEQKKSNKRYKSANSSKLKNKKRSGD